MIKISVDKKTLSIEQMTAINRFEEALEMIIKGLLNIAICEFCHPLKL